MEKLTQMYDELSGVSYDVYKTTPMELKKRLLKDSDLSEEQILVFDSQSEVNATGFMRETVIERRKTDRLTYATLGLESTPFIVSLDSTDGKMRLLDGYNRLFGTYETFTQEILLKVYHDITPMVWMNVMSYANAWKIKSADRSSRYMDRGFKWSLYEHFGIDLAVKPNDSAENSLKLSFMDAYTSGNRHGSSSDRVLATLLRNEQCIQDMAVMKELVLTPIRYKEIKKKEVQWVVADEREFARYNQSLDIVKEKLLGVLGAIRRYEIRNNTKQLPLTYGIIQELLERDDLQKAYVKAVTMQVYGHAENHIKKHLHEAFKEHLMTALGHTYTPPAPKPEPKPFRLEDYQF